MQQAQIGQCILRGLTSAEWRLIASRFPILPLAFMTFSCLSSRTYKNRFYEVVMLYNMRSYERTA